MLVCSTQDKPLTLPRLQLPNMEADHGRASDRPRARSPPLELTGAALESPASLVRARAHRLDLAVPGRAPPRACLPPPFPSFPAMAARGKHGRAGAGETGRRRRWSSRQRKRGSSRADAAVRTWPAASSGAGEAGRAPVART
jgi:hypothetical protein